MLRELGVERADWVKIDTEGAEREVLEGMKDMVFANIIVEVHSMNTQWLQMFAEKSDYRVMRISPRQGENSYFLLTRSA